MMSTMAQAQDLAAVAIDFDHFYSMHYRRALSLAIGMSDSRASAEELTQEAFIEAYKRWDSVGRYDKPIAFVNRVIATRSVSRWRTLGRESRALSRLGNRRDTHGSLSEPTSRDERFWAAVRDLPAQQRQVLVLHYVEDMPILEIANLLDRSEGTVKTQLFRARNGVAERLGTTYLTTTNDEDN